MPLARPARLQNLRATFARYAICLCALTAATLAYAVDVDFQAVAPHVYVHIGETEGRTYQNEALNANIGLIVTPAGAVLVDSGASFQSARQIAQAASKVTSQPIKWVINTGGQDHRWLGNGFFKAQGAEIIAHTHAKSDMLARGAEHLKANAPILKEKMDGTELVLPTRWLIEANTKLELGGTVVEVIHRGGGHTPGDSMVWLPQSGIVLTGDVVYVERILGLHSVSKTKAWLATFEALEALKPKIVVPGHGKVTTMAQAQSDTGSLIRALRAHMKKAIDAGTDVNEAVKSFDKAPFNHLKHVDAWINQLTKHTYFEMEME